MRTGCAEGYCTIVNSKKMTAADLKKYNNKHQANDFLATYGSGRESLFVWMLEDVEIELNPKPYSYSASSWCKLVK